MQVLKIILKPESCLAHVAVVMLASFSSWQLPSLLWKSVQLASCVPIVCPGYAAPRDGGGAVQQLKAQLLAAVTVSLPYFDHKTISPIFPLWPPPHLQVFLQQHVWLSAGISKNRRNPMLSGPRDGFLCCADL